MNLYNTIFKLLLILFVEIGLSLLEQQFLEHAAANPEQYGEFEQQLLRVANAPNNQV
jgi:hypothetical protein